MIKLVWLVPLLPLIGFIIIGLFGKNLSKGIVGTIGSGVILGSFAVALGIFFELKGGVQKEFTIDLFQWISAGKLSIPFSFLIDPVSSLFLFNHHRNRILDSRLLNRLYESR